MPCSPVTSKGVGCSATWILRPCKEAQPDELFTAWLELPDAQRKPMDAELRSIFEMSCEKGFHAILDEAQWHLAKEPQTYTEFAEKLAALLLPTDDIYPASQNAPFTPNTRF